MRITPCFFASYSVQGHSPHYTIGVDCHEMRDKWLKISNEKTKEKLIISVH